MPDAVNLGHAGISSQYCIDICYKGDEGQRDEVPFAVELYLVGVLPLVNLKMIGLAKDWDIDTIIKNCTETKYAAVELRTTHAHKVELNLTPAQRAEVKKKFADSPVRLVSLGSTYEYHSEDPAVVKQNIEGSKEYAVLAKNVGAKGIKVRPNRLMTDKGIPEEQTLKQIGVALHEVGEFAKGIGIDIYVEVHGRGTSRVPRMKTIMDHADHDNVFVTWNCNPTDLEDGGFDQNFELLKSKIKITFLIFPYFFIKFNRS